MNRVVLLSGVSALALMVHEPAMAGGYGHCSWSHVHRTFTCSGNNSGGIEQIDNSAFELNVLNLTHNISPAASRPGVFIESYGSNGGHGRTGYWSWTHFKWESTTSGHSGHRHGYARLRYDGGDFTLSTDAFPGILVRGYGGKGGNGGNANFHLTFSSNGGNGGHGATGTSAYAEIDSGLIETRGYGAFGIEVLSGGGNGGHGGHASDFVAYAGHGGNGGNGGTVWMENYADVTTSGALSSGLYGISYAGNGGHGGNASGAGAVGGNGGKGGAGGLVEIVNYTRSSTTLADGTIVYDGGNLRTSGESSPGILAESFGGIGGNGGSGGGVYGQGGGGSSSGSGGEIIIINNGLIDTSGSISSGILAKSVGGEAGDGGSSGGLVSVGGTGAHSGHGGFVFINNTGTIHTSGLRSGAIEGFSIGGGGGAGGPSGGAVSIGGSGSGGGNGGEVDVLHNGYLVTTGGSADGIRAHSLGGGGGSGASSGGEVSVGGSGSVSGNGGKVTIDGGGSIQTSGHNSPGISAQSIGGGGGSGTNSADGAGTGGSSGGLVSLGGKGGSAGSGGEVTVAIYGDIETSGSLSAAIFAQSLGGGGGRGGSSGGVVSVGGSSTHAGHGGTISITSDGTLRTKGNDSHGIFAHSLGGGGGHGVSSGGLVSVGGSGSGGGHGGNITVENNGSITTGDSESGTGDNSRAIFVQSVGAGGGYGGSSGGAVSVGGTSKGGGGNGGAVNVTNNADLVTWGANADGIKAQSVGDGGGHGGASGGDVSVGGSGSHGGYGGRITIRGAGDIATHGTENSAALMAQSIGAGGGSGASSGGVVSVGGTGSGGGSGGIVDIDVSGDYSTEGKDSPVIFAQSVGGGGGHGGASGGVVSVGGSGSGAGNGNTIYVTQDGNSASKGDGSIAIHAQSIGGGGGHGASSGGVVSVGGSGASSGDGGAVYVHNLGGMTTEGDHSGGILAQSVGGGGGSAISHDVAKSDNNDQSGGGGASGGLISVGGSGSGGGDGGLVNIHNENGITTGGSHSSAIKAHSIGGGGGVGAGSGGSISVGGTGGGGGDGGEVQVINSGKLQTHNADSAGIDASSIGGGGGSGGHSVGVGLFASVSVGGTGGNGGDGDVVSVTNDASDKGISSITVAGSRSKGIAATSIGGGGGHAGWDVDVAVGVEVSANVGIGGTGGKGGTGSGVTVDYHGDIITNGHDADGVYAISTGGGGGTGGFNVSAAGSNGISMSVGIGGTGGDGGHGGEVNVTHNGDITTAGNYAQGITAKSTSDGGGDGAFNVTGSIGFADGGLSVGGKGGNGGDAENVTVTSDGDITTNGVDSFGINAQSIGGGGGHGGFSIDGGLSLSGSIDVSVGGSGGTGATAGDVTVSNTGRTKTTGSGAKGIYAKSIGGGGGDAGFSITAGGDVAADGVGAQINTSVGGDGGQGNTGGDVSVSNDGSISTDGLNADAIYAKSIGGGGGNGGFSGAFSVGLSSDVQANISTSVGGKGGDGNSAGTVTVDNLAGSISTRKDGSSGVYAASIGGGGGHGGWSATGNVNIALPDGFIGGGVSASVSVGGSGGSGNAGGAVTVSNTATGTITTGGDESFGILAKSVGGGGGNGGLSVTASVAGDTSPTLMNASVSIGGDGGTANTGGEVSVNNTQNIVTTGKYSSGILGLSTADGGGIGGLSVDVSLSANVLFAPQLSVGGKGGDGGAAGNVTIVHDADITTGGFGAKAIMGQSLGGGGGNGGASYAVGVNYVGPSSKSLSPSVSVGGSGGTGGVGGDVTLTWSGDLKTSGNEGSGVFGQSIGGGGGIGGYSADIALNAMQLGTGASLSASISVGGDGGTGNHGGKVSVSNTDSASSISTGGASASGVFAQSVGGGGGQGGSAQALNVAFGPGCTLAVLKISKCQNPQGKNNFSLSLGVGGTGGAGGDGGEVTVTNQTVVSTQGDFSHGVFAQSIGGGGGLGGNTNLGLPFDPDPSGPLFGPSGQVRYLKNLQVFVGGSGGASGNGGNITIHNSGQISTGVLGNENLGVHAFGILAQTIGGGGGIGGAASAGLTGKLGIGGSGGASGDGGDISVTNTAAIKTYGSEAIGIFAQSVGGGGGANLAKVKAEGDAEDDNPNADPDTNPDANAGGAGEAQGVGGTQFGLGLMIGGHGGSAGNGGNITLTNSGSIATTGQGAYGIYASSIGGGGGVGKTWGLLYNGLLPAVNGGDGYAGNIDVTSSGAITTSGDKAHGIFLHSASFRYDEDKDPTVSLLVNGDVTTNGKNASAIVVENSNLGYATSSSTTSITESDLTGPARGDINITIAQGVTVSGGIADGDIAAGVFISGQSTATLINRGTLTTLQGVRGAAIFASAWNNRQIVNYGTVTGSVILDSCRSSSYKTYDECQKYISDLWTTWQKGNLRDISTVYVFDNIAGAVVNAGRKFHLSWGGTFNNHGTFAPGAVGNVMTTDFTGHYVQSATGILAIDVDFGKVGQTGYSDVLNVSWDAKLDGNVSWSVLNPNFAEDGDFRLTFLNTHKEGGGGVHNNGLALQSPNSALLSGASLAFGTDSVDLLYSIDFTPVGLNDNQSSVGQHLADVQAAGGTDNSRLSTASAFLTADLAGLQSLYDSMSPGSQMNKDTTGQSSSQAASDHAHSCPQRSGDRRFIREGKCSWFRVSTQGLEGPSTYSLDTQRRSAFNFSGGVQREVAEDTYLGIMMMGGQSEHIEKQAINIKSQEFQVGAILKHQMGGTLLSLFGGAGYVWDDSVRQINLAHAPVFATSAPERSYLSFQGRLAQLFELGTSAYIKPMISAVGTYVHSKGFEEENGQGANMIVLSNNELFMSLRPMVEVGAEFASAGGNLIRPYVQYGISRLVSGTPEMRARLSDAPASVAPFVIKGERAKTTHQAVVGINFIASNDVVIRFEGQKKYTGEFRETEASIKVSLPF